MVGATSTSTDVTAAELGTPPSCARARSPRASARRSGDRLFRLPRRAVRRAAAVPRRSSVLRQLARLARPAGRARDRRDAEPSSPSTSRTTTRTSPAARARRTTARRRRGTAARRRPRAHLHASTTRATGCGRTGASSGLSAAFCTAGNPEKSRAKLRPGRASEARDAVGRRVRGGTIRSARHSLSRGCTAGRSILLPCPTRPCLLSVWSPSYRSRRRTGRRSST